MINLANDNALIMRKDTIHDSYSIEDHAEKASYSNSGSNGFVDLCETVNKPLYIF